MAKEYRTDKKKIDISLTLYPTTLNVIDFERGDLSRSTFVDLLIQELYEEEVKILKS